mmetsp:Transcript_17041/g.69278  ORF Transcript_17041/g.69278 Transcript_17041/m.69278 type:complete len:162 (-) Transcript_17041:73-558(-)
MKPERLILNRARVRISCVPMDVATAVVCTSSHITQCQSRFGQDVGFSEQSKQNSNLLRQDWSTVYDNEELRRFSMLSGQPIGIHWMKFTLHCQSSGYSSFSLTTLTNDVPHSTRVFTPTLASAKICPEGDISTSLVSYLIETVLLIARFLIRLRATSSTVL